MCGVKRSCGVDRLETNRVRLHNKAAGRRVADGEGDAGVGCAAVHRTGARRIDKCQQKDEAKSDFDYTPLCYQRSLTSKYLFVLA